MASQFFDDPDIWQVIAEDSDRLLLYRIRIELQDCELAPKAVATLWQAMRSVADSESGSERRVLIAGGYPYWCSSSPNLVMREYVEISVSEPVLGQAVEPSSPGRLLEREASFLQADLWLTNDLVALIVSSRDFNDAFEQLLQYGLSSTQVFYLLSVKGLDVLTVVGRSGAAQRLDQVLAERLERS